MIAPPSYKFLYEQANKQKDKLKAKIAELKASRQILQDKYDCMEMADRKIVANAIREMLSVYKQSISAQVYERMLQHADKLDEQSDD